MTKVILLYPMVLETLQLTLLMMDLSYSCLMMKKQERHVVRYSSDAMRDLVVMASLLCLRMNSLIRE